MKDIPEAASHTRAYRAVSEAELRDILISGKLCQGPNSLEGKWFADSIDGAKRHGSSLYPDGNFHLIEADLPNDAPSLSIRINLDGFGPARYLHGDDLLNIVPRPLESPRW